MGVAAIVSTTIQKETGNSQSLDKYSRSKMGDHNKKVSLGEADNHIVKPDKESPRFNRAVKVLARLVIAERAAMLAKTQALDLRGSDGEGLGFGVVGRNATGGQGA